MVTNLIQFEIRIVGNWLLRVETPLSRVWIHPSTYYGYATFIIGSFVSSSELWDMQQRWTFPKNDEKIECNFSKSLCNFYIKCFCSAHEEIGQSNKNAGFAAVDVAYDSGRSWVIGYTKSLGSRCLGQSSLGRRF